MAVLGAALVLSVSAQAQVNEAKKIQDEATAIQFAEKAPKLLELIGGADKLAAARPFKATGHGEIWLVISQQVADPKNPAAPKRAVVVQLNADTGAILDVDTF
jgi:hypothetical protein